MKPKRIEVTETIEDISIYDLDGKLDSTIKFLSSLPDNYPEYRDFHLSLNDHDGECAYYLVRAKRLETDKEYVKRVERLKKEKEDNAKLKKEKEDKERAEYLRLKAKFEK